LPKLTEEKIYLEFTPEKQKIFNEFKNDYILSLEQEDITVLSKQILINKCLQLSNGCVYHDKEGNYRVFDDTKLDYVRAYSESHPEENILVFYSYKFDKQRLLTLDGAEAIEDVASKDKWNRGDIKIGVISPYSFQYGGNLQYGGYTIIWFGLLWGLENYLQSNKRVKMVQLIQELSGEEFETLESVWSLAEETKKQLRTRLYNIAEYFENEQKEEND
jgi:hypothetical protein